MNLVCKPYMYLLCWLKEACVDLTVLLVDHDMDFVSQVANSVCCLENGKFIDIGTPVELSERPSLFKELLEASRHNHSDMEDKLSNNFKLTGEN